MKLFQKISFIFSATVAAAALAGNAYGLDAPADRNWLGPRQESMTFSIYAGGYIFESGEALGGISNNPQYDLENAPSVGMRIGYALDRHWETEAFLETILSDSPGTRVNLYRYGLQISYDFITELIFVPYLTVGAGGLTFDPVVTSSETDFMLTYGGGVKVFLLPGFALRLETCAVHSFDDFNTNVAVNLGAMFYATPHRYYDSDGDGIYDRFDKAPMEPEDKDGFEDEDGIPDPDNDGDGIPDTIDKCPNTREDKDGVMDDDGCPDYDSPEAENK